MIELKIDLYVLTLEKKVPQKPVTRILIEALE